MSGRWRPGGKAEERRALLGAQANDNAASWDASTREPISLSARALVSTDPYTAITALAAGNLAALPTETVYGLGGLVSFPGAIDRIFWVKGRPTSHPVIVHIAGVAALPHWAREVPPSAVRLGEAFWPGPLTLVLPRCASVPDSITGGQDTVAVRSPAHPLFAEVLAALNQQSDGSVGIAAPSANRFGQVSPTTAGHVEQELGDRLIAGRDVILDGGPCALGVESTIVIWTGQSWRIAREGGVSRAQLGDIVELAESSPTEVRVPGALVSHYAPKARVVVVDSVSDLHLDPNQSPDQIGLLAYSSVATPTGWYRLAAPRSTEHYAHVMYSALRNADDLKLQLVVAVPPPIDGLGAAIRDRLARAAHS